MRRLAYCLAMVVVLGSISAGLTDDPAAVAPPAKVDGHGHAAANEHQDPLIAEEVRHRLQKVVTFHCDNMPLAEVLQEHLAIKADLDIYLDREGLTEAQIPTDDLAVSGNFRNTTIQAVLKRILPPLNLAYCCDDTGVCVTTKDRHDKKLFARVYDVSPLLPQPPAIPAAPGLTTTAQTPVKSAQYAPGPTYGPTTPGYENNVSDGNQPLTPVALVRAVEQATGGNSFWMSNSGEGGTISILNTGKVKLMVVRQTEAIHAEIEGLLNELVMHHHLNGTEHDHNHGHGHEAAPNKSAELKTIQPSAKVVNAR